MDNHLLTQLFKTEYSNLVAVLCRFYGIKNIQIAEDIVSDTFLHAMKTWSHKGTPHLPKAWLRKVASNKAKDYFRRQQLFVEKVALEYTQQENKFSEPHELVFTQSIIEDSQLNMIFAICHPSISVEAQICLALRTLCGFNIEEIATALLSNKQSINKKLYRAKQKLKQVNDDFQQLTEQDYTHRIHQVLRIIYLIFNEGYYSSISDVAIRQELCWEAMRLNIFLVRQEKLNLPPTHALLALMCFHASRFHSRTNEQGQYILYDVQNRQLWDQDLIQKGEYHLSISAQGNTVSKYHLEAAIAYWHTTDHLQKWNHILQLYNQLLVVEYSPITALNRTYALAKANDVTQAISEALKLKQLSKNHLYYSLLAELHQMNGDTTQQINYLELAIKYAKKESEKSLLIRKIKLAKGLE